MSRRDDALAAFDRAIASVQPGPLMRQWVRGDDATGDLLIGPPESPLPSQPAERLRLAETDRLLVVGGGKAGAGMVAGLLEALPDAWRDRVVGWVNVPADCLALLDGRTLPDGLTVHAGREAGANEPREAGVAGVCEMLRLLRSAGSRDVGLVLLSGGGSALMPAPRGVSLEQKQSVTRLLARAGAPIEDLNRVRRQLSEVKGGGLAAAARTQTLITLAISDVIGDDWGTIASGPTQPPDDPALAADEATRTLRRYVAADDLPPEVWQAVATPKPVARITARRHQHLIATNALAVEAAAEELRGRGYHIAARETGVAGEANALGRDLANRLRNRLDGGPVAILSGGEPTVHFPIDPGRGGRNQQLALAALAAHPDPAEWERMLLLSGGTDGEDGPTDAAGGVIDASVAQAAVNHDVAAAQHASAAYDLLDVCGGLLRTGPTHTNVMDLRIGLVGTP